MEYYSATKNDVSTYATIWILWWYYVWFIVVQSLSHVQLFVTPWTAACQAPPSLRVCSNSCPLSQWCHLTLLSSAAPFCFCLQSFPTSGAFPMNQLFTSGGQSNRASVSASVLPMNIQGWLPFGLTGLIFLQSKELSSTFSSVTIQKHQFFGTQPFLWSNSHIYTWWLEKNHNWLYGPLSAKWCLFFNMLSRLVTGFLPRNKRLLISCLQSSFTVILEPKRRKSVTVSTFSLSICHEVMGSDAMILAF